MAQYVYALHDFKPDHEDELAFRAGDRIEVVERDDLYGDGWWQGRNLEGRVGLFPQTYTTPAPPPPIAPTPAIAATSTTVTSVTTSTMAPTNHLPQSQPLLHLHAPLQPVREEPSPSPGTQSQTDASVEGRPQPIMRATLTDVQHALEQLQLADNDRRSFSFASTHGTTDDEHEGDRGEDWHKGARQRLAEVVMRDSADGTFDGAEVEDEERRAEIERRVKMRPPIEVELSEESESEEDEDEDDDRQRREMDGNQREHPKITEETEEQDDAPKTPAAANPSGNPQLGTRHSFDALTAPRSVMRTPTASGTTTTRTAILSDSESQSTTKLTGGSSLPTPISVSGGSGGSHLPTPQTSKHSSLSSSSVGKKARVGIHPSEWTVDEVLEWLKGKGFGDVCDKFAEQEITGDVLLDLDVNVLKSEIGIIAFGKRMRIANAIAELRRPPSITYSEMQPQMLTKQSSATQSPSYSPGSQLPFVNQSASTSATAGVAAAAAFAVGTGMLGMDSPRTMTGSTSSMNGGWANSSMNQAASGVSGLGFAQSVSLGRNAGGAIIEGEKMGYSYYPASPSESNLTANTVSVSGTGERAWMNDERAVMSESEAGPPSSVRKRFFGRSESPAKPLSSAGSSGAIVKRSGSDKELGQPRTVGSRNKRNMDIHGKTTERLSLFGSVLSGGAGSLVKTRKAAPRESSVDVDSEKERSSLNLSRLYGGAQHRKVKGSHGSSSGKAIRDSVADGGSPTSSTRLQRKRTGSEDAGNRTGLLKAGESVLEQIGEPDHAGFMRKKGERYNTWRHRYFVMRGVHLYALKSNSVTETKIKGYINLTGYKVIADENLDPGRYGFKLIHETEAPHFFSSDEQLVIREWMKAVMKTSIERDYSRVVVSSCNVPTIPLTVAQAMNPAPRPPSPTARAATQRALRRENPNQLSNRDALVLKGFPPSEPSSPTLTNGKYERTKADLGSYSSNSMRSPSTSTTATLISSSPLPPRPNRDQRNFMKATIENDIDPDLVLWANSRLQPPLQIGNGRPCIGLVLLRLAEFINGSSASPPVPDSAFPSSPTDDKLDGLFRLFDFLLDNNVKVGSVSINDVKHERKEKVVQLLKALKAWEEKKMAVTQTLGVTLPISPNGSPHMA